MAYEQGTASGYLDLLSKLIEFVSNANIVGAADPDVGNTGDGTCSQPTADADAPTEDWTLTCTDDSTPGAQVFSVVGSVSGTQDPATVGVAYDDIVQLQLTDGATPFAVGDIFTFPVTMKLGNENVWEVLFNNTGGFASPGRVHLKGVGVDGLDEIFIGIQAFENVGSSIYTWNLQGSVGFSSGLDFDTQPGALPQDTNGICRLYLSTISLSYTFVASPRFIIVHVMVGTVSELAVLGLFDPYGPPSAYPYPLMVFGMGHQNTNSSSEDPSHTWFARNDSVIESDKSGASIRAPGGQWHRARRWGVETQLFTTPIFYVSPTSYLRDPLDVASDEEGGYILRALEIEFAQNGEVAPIGEVPGLYWLIGDELAQNDTTVIGGVTYFIFQNAFRTNERSFLALKLE